MSVALPQKWHSRARRSLEYHPHIMFRELISRFTRRGLSADRFEGVPALLEQTVGEAFADALPEVEESPVLTALGWVSAGLGAVALGLFVGQELRSRYKFNRRTPYDFYAHSGDEFEDMEFGVGI